MVHCGLLCKDLRRTLGRHRMAHELNEIMSFYINLMIDNKIMDLILNIQYLGKKDIIEYKLK